jgi:hypothetical protein
VSSKRNRQPCPQDPGRDVNASTGAGPKILFFSRSVRASDPRLIYLAVYSQSFTERVAFQLFEVLLFASVSRKISPTQGRTFSNFGSVKGSEDPMQEPVHATPVSTQTDQRPGGKKPEQAMMGLDNVIFQCISGQTKGSSRNLGGRVTDYIRSPLCNISCWYLSLPSLIHPRFPSIAPPSARKRR